MSSEAVKEAPAKAVPPYVPFKTFLSALDTLKHGMPNQIDRSVFPSLAGVTQGQVLGTFRFFGLILPDGKPTPELAKLVEDKQRPPLLKKLLEKGYPSLFALGLANASPNSLDAELRKYGLTGDTHDKAKSFFLQAAKFAGVGLSPYLLKVTRVSSGKRRGPAPKPKDTPLPVPANGTPPVTGGTPMKTIRLSSGIDLFLGASADLFAMPAQDRKFVLELLDRIEQYEQENPQEADNGDDGGEEEQES